MSTIHLSEDEFRALFAEFPKIRKASSGEPVCPHCANAFSPENVEYWNQSTEEGTECCEIEIRCDVCGNVAWRGGSWWPHIEDAEDLKAVAEEVLRREAAHPL